MTNKHHPYSHDRGIRLLIALIIFFGLYSLGAMAYTTAALVRWLLT